MDTIRPQDRWKSEIFAKALQEGIIKDPDWLNRLDEPMPAWAILEVALALIEKLDPPYHSYD